MRLSAVYALGALAAASVLAGAPARAAAPGYRTEERFVDAVDGPANDQHVRIDTTLYVPSAVDAAHPAPVVIGAHGFGQDKRALAADATYPAGRGYVVLLYSARGFGDSTGRGAFCGFLASGLH